MLRALITAFRIKEIRNKILFTFGILAIYRLGANITIPGVDANVILEQVEIRRPGHDGPVCWRRPG